MWHEARKQEKLIKGLIVDYRRRAERRRDFYEKIKADPTQFLQIHGRQCKIHLDPAVAAAGESAAIMMPWQGDPDNMIDRFDVRAHLDYIPEVKTPDVPLEELGYEERNCNYERYRILSQNLFLGIAEEKFLHQLSVEEKYGVTLEEKEAQREKQSEKKGTGVAIGFNYDSDTPAPNQVISAATNEDSKDDSNDESDSEMIDVDLSIDVNKIDTFQAHTMNACGANFGMPGTDLFSFLTGDADEAEKSKQLMREEKEKALFSGRKSRRERRAHRDKKLALRVVSPPHYAARPPSPRQLSPSPTRSPSPTGNVHTEKITFITSFGGEEEQQNTSPERITPGKKSYALIVKEGKKRLRSPSPRKLKKNSPVKRPRGRYPSSRKSSTRSRSGSKKRKSNSSSRSRSRSNNRSLSRPRSRHRNNSRSKSRSYSRRRSRSGSSSSRSRSRRCSRSSSISSKSSASSRNNRRRYQSNSKYSRSGNKNASSAGHHLGDGSNTSQHVPTRYYGRKRDGAKSSSSELSLGSDSDDDSREETRNDSKDKMTGGKSSHVSNVVHNSGASSKQANEKLSAKERLRRKMQLQLSRQLRADMKAEAERQEREQLMQQERDDEMRELAIKIRRRQRELRHQQHSQSSNEDSSSPHHSNRSPRNRSRDGSSEKEEEISPKPTKLRDSRSREKSQTSRSSTKQKSSDQMDHSAHGSEGQSSRFQNPGPSDHRGDSKRHLSEFRGGHRDSNYDNRSHQSNLSHSRPYNKYSYRREGDGRSDYSDRHRDQDCGKSDRYWHGRREQDDDRHGRSYNRYSDEEGGRHRRDGRGENVSVKPNKKLVDY